MNNPGQSSGPVSGRWLWSRNLLALSLWPLSLLFCGLVYLRRGLYRRGLLNSTRLPLPVVVVGNISLGGSGKTPVVGQLVRLLQAKGYTPGVLTRGYRSDLGAQQLVLTDGGSSELAGDEANMLSETCGCPIAVGADRVVAARRLMQERPEVAILLSDDGLQHYALQRDLEIIVKRERALGNRWCLPSGPLREPISRLGQCDLLLDRDSDDVRERLGGCWELAQPDRRVELDHFVGTRVYAMAGIGFPEVFFEGLRAAGIDILAMPFADHHDYIAEDLPAEDGIPLLVTHKDAVKLRRFARPGTWVVNLELELSDALQYRFLQLVESVSNG